MTVAPIIVEFEVGVDPARAFDAWTLRIARWWPASHTVTGDPASIAFEPRAGGRIVERGPEGDEHDWGQVLEWQPPHRLRYRWHLFFDPREATEVEVTFTPSAGGTTVRLEQHGFEALGEAGPPRRAKTEVAWTTLAAHFAASLPGSIDG